MLEGIPRWMVLLAIIIFIILVPRDNEKPGIYNRGVLQQTSFEKLKKYVAKSWEYKGYDTEIIHNHADYVDVLAENEEESVAISVRRRQETDSVGVRAVRKFKESLEHYEVDRAIMVTTSSFSKPAQEKAEKAEKLGVLLVDGDRLANIFTECENIPH